MTMETLIGRCAKTRVGRLLAGRDLALIAAYRKEVLRVRVTTPLPADDTPITLKKACRIFSDNQIKPATLRAEHARGNLVITKPGKTHFTTIAALKEMQAKCRVTVPARASGSTRAEEHSPSSTDAGAAARDWPRSTWRG